MVAAAEQAEEAGSNDYAGRHMSAIFKQGFSFSGFERDLLALSLGDGRFLDISGVSGIDSITDGRGAVFADLDNDGDHDVLLTTVQGEAHLLFRNNVGEKSRSLRVTLEGTRSGRDAWGAVVRVGTSRGVQTRIKAGGSGFVSQHDPRLLFGLGEDTSVEWLEITWPGGTTERPAIPAGAASIRCVEGSGCGGLAIAERRFALPDPIPASHARMARLGWSPGATFPDLTLRAPDGTVVRADALRKPGRRTLVNVWATWCVPCAEEMPELEQMRARLAEAGIDVVGVSVDLDTASQVPGYLRDKGITYPVFIADEASVDRMFARGAVEVPLSFLIDGQGRIVDVLVGWSAETRRALQRLAAPRPAAPA